jgi:hypothetical protein
MPFQARSSCPCLPRRESMRAQIENVGLEFERFLVVARDYEAATGLSAPMPVCAVDTYWHDFLKHPAEYQALCDSVAGHYVEHRPLSGEGEIPWVPFYEEKYGALGAIWFSDTNGTEIPGVRANYERTGGYRMAWDCTPFIRIRLI